MAKIVWDQVGERVYETGVDHGVLYLPDNNGNYPMGVAWNGLTSVSEAPTGAESNKQYADNMAYLNLLSVEEFAATLECFTMPKEFEQFDGLGIPTPGVTVGQQVRKPFGLSYRTKKGNDVVGDKFGEKIHLVYGCLAAPSEKAFATVNDSPEPITFSYALTTTPVPVPNLDPTASLVVDSTEVDPDVYAAFKTIIYGTTGVDPRLPLPAEVIAMFASGVTVVTPTIPTQSGDDVTIPTVVGVTYKINGVEVTGVVTITEDVIVTAEPNTGYVFPDGVDDDWAFEYTP